MRSLLLAPALLLLAAPTARAQGAPPAAPAAAPEFQMSCTLFKRDADGAWHVTQPMTLQPAAGPVALKPSRKIRPGTLFGGFDLAAALDESCPH